MTRSTTFAFVMAIGLALTACGGGGGGGGGSGSVTPPPPPPVTGTVSGTAVKGPVNGGTMTAYALSNGAMGAKIASATTNADGTFSLAMGSYAGPVMLQMTGGTYTDEATGATMQLMAGDTMTALLPSMPRSPRDAAGLARRRVRGRSDLSPGSSRHKEAGGRAAATTMR